MIFQGTKPSDFSKKSIIILLIGFVTIGMAVYLFAELAEQVIEEEKFAFDQMVTDWVRDIQAPWLGTVFGWITELGSVILLTVASVLFALFIYFFTKKSRWVIVYFAINMLGISLLTKVLKLLFERQRPEVLQQYDGTGFSFPSGHSTGSMVFYGFLIYMVSTTRWKKSIRYALNTILGLLIFLIGFSRVYLGVHFPTDILAGFAFGISWLFVCIYGLELTLWRQRRRQKRA
ncbi:phosphatase PAP2 family protein [Pontibacillus salipaludis]|uniref:Phosphatase PAP2 family protein n=1 Tax=Pontibacillus salipaludis TaxID=1697394 RepID=A0ABQ1Q2Z2_9BACI|nr:phosphatase PAP2 family protein [Pontibacillus salipaludis]GGD11622.1 phosphatase PAP2 family protein [Pontibacillus salipaludis]